jgi:NADH-quinone oxidoreductase subunit H
VTESLPLWVHLLRVVAAFLIFLLTTAMLIWAERRLVALMQSRKGPNRIGPLGILQTLVDGVKMFFKEDVTPSMVDRVIFSLAPLVAVIVGFLAIAIVPFGGEVTLAGETFVLQAADLNVGVLWFLAMGSLHVYGIVLAGWASTSPYPLMGGVRSSAQMISYEIAQGLAVASVFVYAGSLRVSEIVGLQATGEGLIAGVPNWFVLPLFPAFLLFLVGMVAEAGRPPFDLAEAEGELVAGFHTEYSGMRFGMFMLAEFLNVVTMSAIMVTIFFGGPAGPLFGPDWFRWILPIVWFLAKTLVFIFFFVLLRATLPRIRYDRLMNLGWKVLIPVGLVWVLVTAGMVLVNERATAETRLWVLGGGIALALVLFLVAPLFTRDTDTPADTPRETEEVTA